MTSPAPTSSTYKEYPVVFPAGREEIFGIYAEHLRDPRDTAVILLTGGGFIPMTHRNRMWVRLARALAAERFPVLRFDYHGIGESTGTVTQYWLDRPFVEDLQGAIAWVRRQPITRLVLVGSCFGARTILSASDRIPELSAAVLLSPPLRGHGLGEGAATRFAEELTLVDYLRRAGRARVIRRVLDARWRDAYVRMARVKFSHLVRAWRSADRAAAPGTERLAWVSRKFLEPLRTLARRPVRLLFLYGADEEFYQEFHRALSGELSGFLQEADGRFEVRTVAGILHGFTTVQMQSLAIAQTFDWICRAFPSTGSAPARADALVPAER